ncbi:uncharacterized protein LOC142477222 [Ascaphus truei]|uniref:uncharacterized protein LOC142477222 n=1 Tax=Ascaphus truei TaxID=8439 RepID=UPI003F5A687A
MKMSEISAVSTRKSDVWPREIESDDDYSYYNGVDDDDDGSWERSSVPGTYCGLRRSFLCSQGPAGNHSLDIKLPSLQKITPEEANKNAEELLREEEQEKDVADRKRLKKKRQKDRKRQQKQNNNGPSETDNNRPSETDNNANLADLNKVLTPKQVDAEQSDVTLSPAPTEPEKASASSSESESEVRASTSSSESVSEERARRPVS